MYYQIFLDECKIKEAQHKTSSFYHNVNKDISEFDEQVSIQYPLVLIESHWIIHELHVVNLITLKQTWCTHKAARAWQTFTRKWSHLVTVINPNSNTPLQHVPQILGDIISLSPPTLWPVVDNRIRVDFFLHQKFLSIFFTIIWLVWIHFGQI